MIFELVLYSRPGCHLCDEMLAAIEALESDRLKVSVVNIEGDPDLRHTYQARIPVLVRADTREVLCEHVLDKAAVLSCLSDMRGAEN